MNIQHVKEISIIQGVTQCIAFSFIIAIGAQISIPWQPVPFTLQTICVCIVASILGAKWGTLAVIAYLIEGLMGLPVFANLSSGPAIILGPRGGYLLGFIPAAYVLGRALEHSRSIKSITIGVIGAVTTLFICGYVQLAQFIGYSAAYHTGVEPFFITELVKITASIFCIRNLMQNR